MSRAFLGFCLLCVLLVIACTPTENSNTTTNANSNANAVSNSNTAGSAPPVTGSAPGATTPTSTGAASTATAGKIGVAVCDDFIEKYEACVNDKVPASVRAQYNASLTQWREQWKKLADNPQTRGTLEQVCTSAMEQARAQVKAFNCTF